jgi:hypothetical protein
MAPDEDLNPTISKTVKVQVGKLRDFGARLSYVAERAKKIAELVQRGPHPLGWENIWEAKAADSAEMFERARFFTEGWVDMQGNPLPDEAQVEISVEVLREWQRGVGVEGAKSKLAELEGSRPVSARESSRANILLGTIGLFHQVTGIPMEELDRARPYKKLVKNDEFQTYKEGKLPWWVHRFCREYDYLPTEALEFYRRFKDPDFKKEYPYEYEDLRRFMAIYAWETTCRWLKYIQSDKELGSLALKVYGLIEGHELSQLSTDDISDTAGLMRRLAEEWKARHGEPPS